jgi:multiple sugar transport system ATP-binding protein
VAQCGSPLALYHRPRSLFVAGFIGSPKMNFLPGTLVEAGPDSARVRLPGGELLEAAVDARGLAPGAAVTLGLRPEHTLLGTAVQHLVRPVRWQERLGEATYLYLDGSGTEAPLIVKAPGATHAQPGHRIAFGLPANALHCFDAQGLALPRCVADEDITLPAAA